jgi:hypothetical protein
VPACDKYPRSGDSGIAGVIIRRSSSRTVSTSATLANAFVSNSAGADQCQSLKRQRRLDRPSIALAHFGKNPRRGERRGKSKTHSQRFEIDRGATWQPSPQTVMAVTPKIETNVDVKA